MSFCFDAKPALITGATGFIGRQLVNALLDRKATICVLVRDPAKSGPWSNQMVTVRLGDLDRWDSLSGVCAGVDTVFHLASCSEEEGVHRRELASSPPHPSVPKNSPLPMKGGEGKGAGVPNSYFHLPSPQPSLGGRGSQGNFQQTISPPPSGERGFGQEFPGEDLHWRVTVEGTRRLLEEAAQAGVKRFIYVSSVKAMGEGGDACLDETSPVAPLTLYGRAKLEAERLVLEMGMKHDMHVCNLRLPPVYGRDNRGNLWRMMAAVDRGRFPPLPEVGNRRSMVHVDDVVQALLLAADNPAARGKTYIVTDGCAYSTREIYIAVCAALGRAVPRWTVPLGLLRMAAGFGDIVGRMRGKSFIFDSEILGKLTGSAWYSCSKIEQELGYRPTRTLEEGLREMVAACRREAVP